MIDIVLAMESVVAAVAGETNLARRRHRINGGPSLAEAALSLAVPSARGPSAHAHISELRRDPRAAAEAWDCTLGAVLVWRAVDRAERAGASWFAAAEAGLTCGLTYIGLMPERLRDADLAIDAEPGYRGRAVIGSREPEGIVNY